MTTADASVESVEQANGPIRLGAVGYLNTRPLIEGLEKLRDVELHAAAPSALLDGLLGGHYEAALTPVVDAQTSPEPLALLPVGAIACDGPTMTVRLLSRRPFEQTRRVEVDSESKTSVALMRIILARRFDVVPEIASTPFTNRSDWPETILMIGDKIVADAPPDEVYPYALDLGRAWKELTDLPFVYAVWSCRAERADSPKIQTAAAILDRQRRRNGLRLEWIARRRAGEHGWPIEAAKEYFADVLHYEPGEAERRAVERFFDEAASLGLFERRAAQWV